VYPPFVEPAANKEDTIKCFITMGKMGYVAARKLYDGIIADCRNNIGAFASDSASFESKEDTVDESAVLYLNRLAEKWRRTGDEKLLEKLKGMEKDKAKLFLGRWFKQRNMRRLYLLGMTRSEIEKCELSTDEIYEKCKTNPLTLYGIDIKKAIEIMGRLGMTPTGEQIICGKILRYVYENNVSRGWMGTPSKIILQTYPDFPKYKEQLESEYSMLAELHTVYIKKHAYYEHKVARYINELMKDNSPIMDHPYFACGKDAIMFTDEQKQAVTMALNSGVSVITGGAGVGKSTIISSIIHNLELLGQKYLLCSFTGKAASVIKRITGRNAYTVHKLISSIGSYIDADHGISMLIIDEASMLTTSLFCQLMDVLDYPNVPLPKVVFCGDISQLPPIEAGTLMYEVLKVKEIPSTFLTVNMRVTDKSDNNGIIINSEKIVSMADNDRGFGNKTFKGKSWDNTANVTAMEDAEYFEGIDPFDDFDPDDIPTLSAFNPVSEGQFQEFDNFTITLGNIDLAIDIIIDHHKQGGDQCDLTIISPYNRDLKLLNEKFQQIYHSEDLRTKDHWGNVWCVGDRVMCLENNNELGISNGEEGIVSDYDDRVLRVIFNKYKIDNNRVIPIEKIVELPLFPKLKNRRAINLETLEEESVDEYTSQKLCLSYAITVHKSQGSQWKKGVIYLPGDYKATSFINRNLIYTSITRFSQEVHVIGNTYMFQNSIDVPLPYRHDCLALRIKLVREDKGHTSKVHDDKFKERGKDGVVELPCNE
jgi:hypothetical protein